ncbi:hypothetical protein V5799_024674 [Amblyomma americanum]|uniref:Uncharacterized protein n=1 Tax=Amblyomma americanum TaxID=6943 RepID=A0AAQ4EBW0_AMBAM
MLSTLLQAAFVEVAMSTLMDAYPSLQGRRLICTAALCATLFTLSVPAATGGGMYMINLVDSVTYLDLVPWVALAEMILIVYGYGEADDSL